MNFKKALLVFAVIALTISLVACSSGGSSDKPAPAGDTYVPIPAADPANQPLVDMIEPNLKAKVKSGEITQERMNEIVTKVGTGELTIEQVQAIMMGQAN